MTLILPATAALALLLGHLARSRGRRLQRQHAARELRRDRRERQWRAMILGGEDDRAN